MIGLGLTPETAEKFFMAIDVDGTGGVEVAELFRAGAFLRGGGAKKGATEPTSPFRNGSQPEVSTSAVKLTTEGSSAPAANGVVAVGVTPVPAKQPMSSADLQLKLEALKTKLKNRAQWWTQERWDPTYEMRSTLRFLKPNKMADAKVRIRMAPPYIFKAGRVEARAPAAPRLPAPARPPPTPSTTPPSPF